MTDTAGVAGERTLTGVGQALAQAREEQGLGVADVAQQLKFMARQIESLEAERFEALPGPTIARGMVRSYARLLKLDPEPLIEMMAGRIAARDATPQLAARFNQPVPFSDSGRRSTVVYLGLSAVVLVVAGVVFYQWRHERSAPEQAAAQVPAKQVAVARAQLAKPPAAKEPSKESVAVATAEPPPPPPPAAPVKEAAAPKAVKDPAAKDLVAKEQVVKEQAVKEQAVKEQAPVKSAGPNRLVIRFEEAAWAEVTDALGRQLVSSLNPAGTERVVRGVPPFNLVIGNAQHVKVSYNDREIDLQPHVKVEVARFTVK